MNISIDVKAMGAIGDGVHDDSAAFQAALDAGAQIVTVPYGKYLIGRPLLISSNTELRAHRSALIRLGDRVCTQRGQFLLSNKNAQDGDENIEIIGGIWDGNCMGNPRGELFDPKSPSGSMFNFRNVKNLTLSGMTLRDSECYYMRLCEIDGFLIEHIAFESQHIRPNQDGVHLGGFCKNGVIRHLSGTPGSPNDDFIALNADDCLTRLQNLDMLEGPIENLTIHDISSKECHSFVRILSVNSRIENISISGLRGGCKAFAVNMDAARYSLTPITPKDPDPDSPGVGDVRNVSVDDAIVYPTRPNKSLICLESNMRGFRMRNFRVDTEHACAPMTPTMNISNVSPSRVRITGLLESGTAYADEYGRERHVLEADIKTGGELWLNDLSFDELVIDAL